MKRHTTTMNVLLNFGILRPPVTELEEEPSAAGGPQYGFAGAGSAPSVWCPRFGVAPGGGSRDPARKIETNQPRMILPPPVTQSDEEPIAAGGRRF